jgi:hypothetical protein
MDIVMNWEMLPRVQEALRSAAGGAAIELSVKRVRAAHQISMDEIKESFMDPREETEVMEVNEVQDSSRGITTWDGWKAILFGGSTRQSAEDDLQLEENTPSSVQVDLERKAVMVCLPVK